MTLKVVHGNTSRPNTLPGGKDPRQTRISGKMKKQGFIQELLCPSCDNLDVLAHHSNHQVEQTHGLDEGKAQNGVGEELATEGRVAGDTHEESGENETDTDTGTTETDGGGTHTNVLGDLNHGGGDLGGVLAAGGSLEGLGLEEGGRLDALGGTEGGDGGLLGGEGTLGGSVELEAGSRAGDLGGLGGHGGHTGGEDTRGGHCDGYRL
jgi:Zn ribbon nucleic-acid-binding protein